MEFDLFPIKVKYYNYLNHKQLKQFLEELNYASIPSIVNENGTTSYYQNTKKLCLSLFKDCDHSAVKDFHEFCITSANDYAKNYLEYDLEHLICTSSWINHYTQNSGQAMHNHTNSLISANYFIAFNSNSDLKFWNPQFTNNTSKNTLQINKITNIKNSYNYDWITLPGIEGNIVFFPSWLTHSVDSINNSTRKTISMNFLPNKIFKDGYGFILEDKPNVS